MAHEFFNPNEIPKLEDLDEFQKKQEKFYDEYHTQYKYWEWKFMEDSVGLFILCYPIYLVLKWWDNFRNGRQAARVEQIQNEINHENVDLGEKHKEQCRQRIAEEEANKPLEDNPFFALAREDFDLLLEEMQLLYQIMTGGNSYFKLRGKLRWLLSLPEDEREHHLKRLKTEILYRENMENYGSREEFEKYMSSMYADIKGQPKPQQGDK